MVTRVHLTVLPLLPTITQAHTVVPLHRSQHPADLCPVNERRARGSGQLQGTCDLMLSSSQRLSVMPFYSILFGVTVS